MSQSDAESYAELYQACQLNTRHEQWAAYSGNNKADHEFHKRIAERYSDVLILLQMHRFLHSARQKMDHANAALLLLQRRGLAAADTSQAAHWRSVLAQARRACDSLERGVYAPGPIGNVKEYQNAIHLIAAIPSTFNNLARPR